MNNITFAPCAGRAGCAADGTGYKIMFASTPATAGTATITVKVKGSTGLIGYTSFTLHVDPNTSDTAKQPPSIATLPGSAIQQKTDGTGNYYATYTAQFTIEDLGATGEDLDKVTFSFGSDKSSVVNAADMNSVYVTQLQPSSDPDIALLQQPSHAYILTAKSQPNVTGVATITVTVTDPDMNTRSTSFVMQVVSSSNEPPSFSPPPGNTFVVCPSPTPQVAPTYTYTLKTPTDGTLVTDLRVSATSSNTKLVPNDLYYLSCSQPISNTGTVTIKPTWPVPAPSPAVPQATTITLSVEDDVYVRQSSFLYVVKPASGDSASVFSRPTGVYPTQGADNLVNDAFLNGDMLALQWDKVENSANQFDFATDLDSTIDNLPLGKDLSLDLQKEPCYIAHNIGLSEYPPYCDTNSNDHPRNCEADTCDGGFKRAVPWDHYLRGRPKYKDANGTPLIALADEFNGVMRPRVSFFQETMAAARTPIPPPPTDPTPSPTPSSNAPNYSTPYSPNSPKVATTAYTSTPMNGFIPSFAFYGSSLTNDTYNNGIVMQSNTVWSDPFADPAGDKFIKTVNGSPNDALEGAFNTFHSEYLEVFPQDIDQAFPTSGIDQSLNAVVWASQLQSWHDYAASLRLQPPLEAPAGLDVTYVSSTMLNLKCYPVYGATSYTVDTAPLGTPPGGWSNAASCDPTLAAGCNVTVLAGTEYAVRVAAKATSVTGAYAYAALFLSEFGNDGFIRQLPSSYMNHPGDTEPGILAGEPMGTPPNHDKGFLSFRTGDLGAVSVLGAKLRLYQGTPGGNLGINCMVDIKKGYFYHSAGLEKASDFNDTAETSTNVFSIQNVGQFTWFEANLTGAIALRNINTSTTLLGGETQFRIYFPPGSVPGREEGWYSGNSGTYPPQLLVRYQ